mmetsp:Transcript_40290/g.75078  ORF Transcript_40290/g.75078 Transcript_40290/m.75078 type:complete len:89 (-) Transcript_40290:29-295(-)
MRRRMKISNRQEAKTAAACKIKNIPTPKYETINTGLRPTMSLKYGNKKTAKNIPEGKANVISPVEDGAKEKWCSNEGRIGPPIVKPSK